MLNGFDFQYARFWLFWSGGIPTMQIDVFTM